MTKTIAAFIFVWWARDVSVAIGLEAWSVFFGTAFWAAAALAAVVSILVVTSRIR